MLVLGFTNCNDPVDEYGAPSAKYKIKGNVIADEENSNPVENIQIVIKRNNNQQTESYPNDTVYSDKKGEFSITKETGFSEDMTIKIELTDIDEEINGSFEEKEVTVEIKKSDFKGGSGWFQGEANKEIKDIRLTPRKE